MGGNGENATPIEAVSILVDTLAKKITWHSLGYVMPIPPLHWKQLPNDLTKTKATRSKIDMALNNSKI